MKLCLFSFLAMISSVCLAQKEADLLSDNNGWYEGSIMLSDGSELKGLIKYNDKNGFLAYHSGQDSRALTPRTVMAFEFFDESIQKQRVFYTFEHEDSKTNVKRPLFFEVLKEFKSFAFLILYEPIEVKQKQSSIGGTSGFHNGVTFVPGTPGETKTYLDVSQKETIFLMNDNGQIEPYIKIINKEDGRKSLITGRDTKTRNQMIDEDLLARYIGAAQYEELKNFARDNNLRFKVKEDLLQILEYYERNLN